MIYLVIGPSCAGKTQFVHNSFLQDETPKCVKDLIKVTISGNNILIGDYTKKAKVRGTDRISRSQLKLIAPQIIKSYNEEATNVIAEGVNICYPFVLDQLIEYKDEVKFIYIYCSKSVSLLRNKQLNDNANMTWFKNIWTKSYNTFMKYADIYDSYLINTDTGIDFNTFSLQNCSLNKFNPIDFGNLF